MNKTARTIVWVLVIVLSLASAAIGVYYYTIGRTKHGLLFLPVIPVGLVIVGAAFARPRAKTAEGQQAKTP